MGQTIANVFYKQRADFLEEQKERDKRLKFPDDVEEIRDIQIGRASCRERV